MAGGVNKVIIIGNLGRDPEMRYFQDGTAVANLNVATSESWTDKNTGERREKTEWHRIVAFRRLAEICGQYLSKGRQVYVEGKLQTREWQDQDGNRRWTTEIVAQTVQFLGSRGDSGQAQGYGAPYQGGYPQGQQQSGGGYYPPGQGGGGYQGGPGYQGGYPPQGPPPMQPGGYPPQSPGMQPGGYPPQPDNYPPTADDQGFGQPPASAQDDYSAPETPPPDSGGPEPPPSSPAAEENSSAAPPPANDDDDDIPF